MAEAFLYGNGGDNPLNFKVVGGTSAPSNPKENTIWIDTDMKVTGYQFSSKCRGKNLLENTAQSETVNGVTFTVNDDGSVTVNGTATNGCYYALTDLHIPNGNYILSGCPSGGSTNTYALYLAPKDQSYMFDTGNGVSLNIDNSTTYIVRILITQNTVVNNLTFYPMIRLASETDDTYEPYVSTEEGFVWIMTDTESNASFNALKKNAIQVYPASAKQYVSGKWVDKTAKIYQGGKWVDWWDGELYKNGITYNDVTGGFTNTPIGPNATYPNAFGNATITYNANNMGIANNEGGSLVHTVNKLKLSGYKELVCELSNFSDYTVGSQAFLQIRKLLSGYLSTNVIASATIFHNSQQNPPKLTVSIDLSSLSLSQSDDYYVVLGFYGKSNTNVTAIYLS